MDQCESTMEKELEFINRPRERRQDAEEQGESKGRWQVKTIIMIIGAGATGKTTLSCALAGENAAQHHVDLSITQKGERKRFKAPYVLGSDIAIAGNLKNTSDAIGAMDALHQTIDHCLKERDTVIMDGFRCTQKLVRWIEDHPLKPAALFVFIELSLNTQPRPATRTAGRERYG